MPARADKGSQLKLYMTEWGPLYESVLQILGSTGTILSIGDPHHGQPDATTFTTVGEEQATFTGSSPWREFDGHNALGDSETFPYKFKGIVPFISCNGTDEEADTPDSAYWSRDDSAGQGFSVGAWVQADDTAGIKTILDKFNGGGTNEWSFHVNAAEFAALVLQDDSAGVSVQRPSATAVNGSWTFIAISYTGAGGEFAAQSINFYTNGSLDNGTATTNASYVAMEDLASPVALGRRNNNQFYFSGDIAGGPLGPFFTHKILQANEVKDLYELGRRALWLV